MKPLPYPFRNYLSAAVAFALFTPTAFAEPAETPSDKLPTVTVTAEHCLLGRQPHRLLLGQRPTHRAAERALRAVAPR